MASHAAKLCNPTPFFVELPWHRGIDIPIPPFGDAEITMQQMDDFRPGKPGSENVRSVLDFHGLFLYDVDRPYDNQALEALKRSHKAKKSQYDEAVKNLRVQRAQAGIAPQEAAFEENLRQLGYFRLHEEIEKLEKAIEKFKTAVGEGPERSTRPQFDPDRTVMVMDPPRQFPSVAAMEFYLEENPEIKAKHEAFRSEAQAKATPSWQQSTFVPEPEKRPVPDLK